jgi:glycerol-3-phosphate dehydrogenase (NAD(P)+)
MIPKNAMVIGAGTWGTALATLLLERGIATKLWCHRPETAEEIQRTRRNRGYTPDMVLPDNLEAVSDPAAASGAGLVVFVVPTGYFRDVARRFKESGAINREAVIVTCSKGIERGSDLRMSQILEEMFPNNPIAALSGPNHAEEVINKMPTAAVVGSRQPEVANLLQQCFMLPWFRSYTSEDIAGIEWAGAMKNVYAIASGICDGLGLGDNAKGALVTRGLAEMVRFGIEQGGRAETFYGLSGVGDLVATCFSAHSRNLRVGRELGQGRSLKEIVEHLGMIAEGVENTRSLYESARRAKVRTPLIDACHGVLYENKPARAALVELLSRDPRPETD